MDEKDIVKYSTFPVKEFSCEVSGKLIRIDWYFETCPLAIFTRVFGSEESVAFDGWLYNKPKRYSSQDDWIKLYWDQMEGDKEILQRTYSKFKHVLTKEDQERYEALRTIHNL